MHEQSRPGPSLVLLCAATAVAPIGFNIVLPALPALALAFAAADSVVFLVMSIYMLTFSVLQLVLGPVADRYGRRPVLLVGLAVFTVASLGCALAPTLESLLLARFAQAAGGCVGLVLPRAVVRDCFNGIRAAGAMTAVTMVFTTVPAVAPLVGGLLVSVLDWRTAFLFCAIYGAVALMWTWVAFPETLARTQIRHGASRYLGLLKDRSYVAYMLNAALLTVPYVLFLTAAPKLLIGGLGLSPAAFGAYILLLVVSVLAGSAAAARLARRHAIGNVVRGASWMAVVSVAAALALSEVLTVWRVLGPMLAYVAAHAVLFPLALAGGIAAHASKAGTAAGFIGFAQTGIAGVAVLLLGQLDTIGAETVAFLSLIAALAGLASLRLARAPQR